LFESSIDCAAIFHRNGFEETPIAAIEGRGGDAVQGRKIMRPVERVAGDVPRPNADLTKA
jgi:hypothetical protein